MSDLHRRDVLRSAAIAATLGQLTPASAQHVHQQAGEAKKANAGRYQPKVFNEHEYKTVALLADLIIPPEGAGPGGAAAGAPEFIDLLCSGAAGLARTWLSGLAWLDSASLKRYQATFGDAKAEQQTALVDLIAYRKNETPELAPGIRFFDWARRMVVDAYFTSPAGVKAIGFQGNVGMQTFQVPVEALTFALQRSPFKEN